MSAEELFDVDVASRTVKPRTPPWPTLGPEALHGLAGEIVEAIAPQTEADPAALLVDLLASTGNAIGAGPHAIADGAIHPPRLFAVIVGRSARARKGTSRARVNAVMELAEHEWATGCAMSGFGSGEGIVAELADSKRGDVRLFVDEGEFARVLAACDRQGSTLSSTLRDAWDGRPLRKRTATERLVVRQHHVAVVAHITVEELQRRLTNTEAANGFANRFLWVCARRAQLLPDGGHLDQRLLRDVGRRLNTVIADARKVALVTRTDDASKLWAHLYGVMADEVLGGLAGALTARAEAQCLRLSLIYALLDGQASIDVPHLEAAWAVWRYCESSVRFVFGDTTGDPDVDRLIGQLHATGGLDGRELDTLFGDRAPAVRQRAEAAGWITIDKEQTKGRPRTVVRLSGDFVRRSAGQRSR